MGLPNRVSRTENQITLKVTEDVTKDCVVYYRTAGQGPNGKLVCYCADNIYEIESDARGDLWIGGHLERWPYLTMEKPSDQIANDEQLRRKRRYGIERGMKELACQAKKLPLEEQEAEFDRIDTEFTERLAIWGIKRKTAKITKVLANRTTPWLNVK